MEVAAGPGHPAAAAPPFSAVAPSTLFPALELADLSPSTRQPALRTAIPAPQQVAPAQAVTWCTYPSGLAGNGVVSPESVPSALFWGLLAQCAVRVQQQPCTLPQWYGFSWDSSASAYTAAVQPAVAHPPSPQLQRQQEFQRPACEEAAAGHGSEPFYELEIVVVGDDPPAVASLQCPQQQWLQFQQFVCEEAAAAPGSFPPAFDLDSQASVDLAPGPSAVSAVVVGGISSGSCCAAAVCVPGPAAYSIGPFKPSSRLSVWSGFMSIGIGWSSGSLELAFGDSFVAGGGSSSFGGDAGSFWQLWDVGALEICAAASRVPAGIG